MRRDPVFDTSYWDGQVAYLEQRVAHQWEMSADDDVDEEYKPQYIFDIAVNNLSLMLCSYSRGNELSRISGYFEAFLDAWEESDRLGSYVWSDDVRQSRKSWSASVDAYWISFLSVGIAILLNVPDLQWQRLVLLIGNEERDAVLDQVIASRQPGRRIGRDLCYPRAYKGLLDVISGADDQRPELLRNYVGGWFSSLESAGSSELPWDLRMPWWWLSCVDEKLGQSGGYIGCWCVEAAVVAKVFGIDDGSLVSQPHYPADLLRDDRSPRYPDLPPGRNDDVRPGLLGRLKAWLG